MRENFFSGGGPTAVFLPAASTVTAQTRDLMTRYLMRLVGALVEL